MRNSRPIDGVCDSALIIPPRIPRTVSFWTPTTLRVSKGSISERAVNGGRASASRTVEPAQDHGYWVTFADPWPETWAPTWFQSDHVYLEYDNDGYCIYDVRTPASGSRSRSTRGFPLRQLLLDVQNGTVSFVRQRG